MAERLAALTECPLAAKMVVSSVEWMASDRAASTAENSVDASADASVA